MTLRQRLVAKNGKYRTTIDDFVLAEEQLVIEIKHAPTVSVKQIEFEVMLASVVIDGSASTIATIEVEATGLDPLSRALWIKGVTPAQFHDEHIVFMFTKQRLPSMGTISSDRQTYYTHA